jgi:hypothetical protein
MRRAHLQDKCIQRLVIHLFTFTAPLVFNGKLSRPWSPLNLLTARNRCEDNTDFFQVYHDVPVQEAYPTANRLGQVKLETDLVMPWWSGIDRDGLVRPSTTVNASFFARPWTRTPKDQIVMAVMPKTSMQPTFLCICTPIFVIDILLSFGSIV